MGQLVPLMEWASSPKGFKYPPAPATLHRYAKTGQIIPAPIKQGSKWIVDENAKYVGVIAKAEIPSHLPASVRALLEKTINGSQTPHT